ncbi:hypothetical protein C8C85_0574 [Flavobacterium sp. 103]|nr:hypothetical protein C8C85_0574 [Flavobacterium sp. 103]
MLVILDHREIFNQMIVTIKYSTFEMRYSFSLK